MSGDTKPSVLGWTVDPDDRWHIFLIVDRHQVVEISGFVERTYHPREFGIPQPLELQDIPW